MPTRPVSKTAIVNPNPRRVPFIPTRKTPSRPAPITEILPPAFVRESDTNTPPPIPRGYFPPKPNR